MPRLASPVAALTAVAALAVAAAPVAATGDRAASADVVTVEVLLDGRPAICAVPATRRLDLEKLRSVTGATAATLATEGELGELFPDCELGAMPPFGNLYGQTTFVDEELRESERIAFHAGDHRSAIEIAYSDFERLVEPVPGEFSAPERERP